ncbi:MAG: replication-associated recombination protein A [Flavobacteriaceae bacterium]|jgi:putative ATPase
MNPPLAERMRPVSIDQYIGQTHLVGPKGALRPQLESGLIASMILWGPPGTGKTTLAGLLAKETKREIFHLSAIDSGVAKVREVIQRAKDKSGLFAHANPILFIDEIHRFSKSQQDALLGAVEKGWVTLIGATTEQPSFEVIPALLSRCQVYTLKALKKEELLEILNQAIAQDAALIRKSIKLQEYGLLLQSCGGDARKLLNTFELIVIPSKNNKVVITDAFVRDQLDQLGVRYDKSGDQHYDIASAMIKSIRGSDPNAALYWLSRMLIGGESLSFIGRRLIISAAEDIGLANPTALIMAQSSAQAIQMLGLPEARIILGQCILYLAMSPKSNSAYQAINKAMDLAHSAGPLPVPLHLRNATNDLNKELGYGKGYTYDHDAPNGCAQQNFLPPEIENERLYHPSLNQREQQSFAEFQKMWSGNYPK